MNEFRAIVFEGAGTAQRAFFELEEQGVISWLNDVAVVARNKHGFIRVHSTWAQDDRDVVGGIGLGTLTGALIGALLGPQGAIAGAAGAGALAGGTLGGFFGVSMELATEDPRLDRFAKRLKDDTSALIVVGTAARAEQFVSAFEGYKGEVIETQLNEHDVRALSEALRAEQQRS